MAKILNTSCIVIMKQGSTVTAIGSGQVGSTDDPSFVKSVQRTTVLDTATLQKIADVFAANEAAIKVEQGIS